MPGLPTRTARSKRRNGHLKRTIKEALELRGLNDFAELAAYRLTTSDGQDPTARQAPTVRPSLSFYTRQALLPNTSWNSPPARSTEIERRYRAASLTAASRDICASSHSTDKGPM